MKKIETFVKPFTLEAVKASLAESGVHVVRIAQVQELNAVNSHAEVYRGTEYEIDVAPRILVMFVVDDDEVDSVVERLRVAGQTDQPGEGEIVVTAVERQVFFGTQVARAD